jgi:DNA replication initiation complex subunit (GINS family)
MADQYTRLLEWRRSEGSTRGLAKLPHDFYATTQEYLAEARSTFESELRSNPAGKKGEVARQTYQRASQIARDVVEARMMKLLTLAFQASVGGSREVANALAEERALYDRMLEILKRHRTTVAPFLEPVAAGAAAATPPMPAAPSPEVVRSAAAPTSRPGMVFVRILKDGPPIDVGGEVVDLKKEDVLSLPAETARLLVQGKVAERIEAVVPS